MRIILVIGVLLLLNSINTQTIHILDYNICDVINCATSVGRVCKTCKPAYLLSNGLCNACNVGYRISDLNKLDCIPVVPNCLSYNLDFCKVCT